MKALFPTFILLSIIFGLPCKAQTLRFKFPQGKKHSYDLNLDGTLSGKVLGTPSEVKFWLKAQLETTVLEVISPEKAKVSLKFPFLAFELKLPPPIEGIYAYNSKNPIRRTPIDKSIADWFDKFLTQQTVLTLNPRGTIEDIQLPAIILEGLGENRSKPESVAGLASEEGLEGLLKQFDFVLPAAEVAPGDPWTKLIRIQTPVGLLGMDFMGTYSGKNDWGMERFSGTPTMSLQDGKSAIPLNLKIRDQKGEFEWLFNPQEGCLESLTHSHTVWADMTILGQETRAELILELTLERL